MKASTLKRLKERHSDALILVRCSPYYRLFNNDAEVGHNVLGIEVLELDRMHVAEFDISKLDMYLPKLVHAGYRIAIVDNF